MPLPIDVPACSNFTNHSPTLLTLRSRARRLSNRIRLLVGIFYAILDMILRRAILASPSEKAGIEELFTSPKREDAASEDMIIWMVNNTREFTFTECNVLARWAGLPRFATATPCCCAVGSMQDRPLPSRQ